jgi:hypothetical protein
MKIRVTFKIDHEAEAFAREFGGALLDTPKRASNNGVALASASEPLRPLTTGRSSAWAIASARLCSGDYSSSPERCSDEAPRVAASGNRSDGGTE